MTRAYPRLGSLAIGLAFALIAAHAMAFAASLDAAALPAALLGLLLGALLADAVTGLVHWSCDTWGDERTPWLGPSLIAAFRAHHRDPRAMLAEPFGHRNREPALAAAAALVLLHLPAVQRALEERFLVQGLLCALLVYGGTANQLHAWAHAERPPRPARLLQRAGLVLSPERHARHHAASHTTAYCISTGWLNPALDRMGFWRALERGMHGLTGSAARPPRPADRRL